MCVVVVLECEAELFDVIDALGSASSFASLLNCGQQESDEDGNDGDDHQQFDESETWNAFVSRSHEELLLERHRRGKTGWSQRWGISFLVFPR